MRQHERVPRVAVSCVLALLAIFAISTGAAAAEFDTQKLARVREAIQPFVDDVQVAGVVAAAGNAEGIASLEAVGWQNIERQEPMRADALFRIASMTKPITGLGIMILVDEGKLALDDPVEKHLSEFRGQMLITARSADSVTVQKPPRPITIRDLMTHTSGMNGGYGEGLANLYERRQLSLAEGVFATSGRPLEFEPGSKWSYCNAGIDTAGRIIEVVSGQPYEQFLEQRVFKPLGMVDTGPFPDEGRLARTATLYAVRDEKFVVADGTLIGSPVGARHPIPAGGLYSTAADLARLYQMLLGHGELAGQRILSEQSWREMTRVQTGDLECGFTPGIGFGIGCGVVKEPQGVTGMLSPGTFGHGGAFGTQGWIDPHRGVFIILLVQRIGLPNADASDLRRVLQENVMDSLVN